MDKIGSTLLALALIFTLIPVTFGPQRDWVPLDIVITDFWVPIVNIFVEIFVYFAIPLVETLIIGLVLLGLFFFVEFKVSEPILNFQLFRNRKFASTNLEAFFIYVAHYSIYVVVAFYLSLIKLLDPFWTGIFLAFFPLVASITSPISGWFSDKYDKRDARILAAGIIALSLLLMSRLTPDSSIEFLLVALGILGVGMGLFSPANTAECLTSVPNRDRSMANGILGMMRYSGQTLSYAVSAAIIGLYLPTNLFIEGGPVFIEQYMAGISQSLIVSAVLASIAMLIGLLWKERKTISNNEASE